MKRKFLLAIIAAAVIIALGGIYGYANYFGSQTVMQTNSSVDCRQGNIFDGVDRQARFTVLSTCETAVGIVQNVENKQSDGDYQFNLAVEPQYQKLLNSQNNGLLVVEIIPKDQNSTSVTLPKNGDKIEVDGAWVTDNPHGWNEIHPAWKVKTLA